MRKKINSKISDRVLTKFSAPDELPVFVINTVLAVRVKNNKKI